MKWGSVNSSDAARMETKLFWLAFKACDDYTLCTYWAESRQGGLVQF